MNVHLVRLVTNEEIMGFFVSEEDDGGVTIQEPMVISEASNDHGTYMVLNSYMPYHEAPQIAFKGIHVLDHHKVHPTIAQYYELSLIMSKKYDANRLVEIDSVNQSMFDHIISDNSNTSFLHKGTNTHH